MLIGSPIEWVAWGDHLYSTLRCLWLTKSDLKNSFRLFVEIMFLVRLSNTHHRRRCGHHRPCRHNVAGRLSRLF